MESAARPQRKALVEAFQRGISPSSAEGLETLLKRYFRVLCAMEKRFAGADLRIQFAWRDAFQKVAKQGEADIHFERTAVLFNLCAVCSFLAVHQSRNDAAGIKAACQRYQSTAGLLELLEQDARARIVDSLAASDVDGLSSHGDGLWPPAVALVVARLPHRLRDEGCRPLLPGALLPTPG